MTRGQGEDGGRWQVAGFTFHVSRITHHASRWWPLLIFGGLLLLFFRKMAFSNLILGRGDTFLYFYPYWQAAAEALGDGRLPLWNPHLFMGAPFLANSQVGFFYPLNWPLWLLLPTPYAVSASILLHLLIAGVGAYLAGRRCLELERWPALLAAVLFGLGGYLTAQVEHVNQLQGLAWLPWFLVVIGEWRSGQGEGWRGMVRPVALLAGLFTLQLLAGHSQTTFITAVGVTLWLCARPVYASRFTHHVSRITFQFLPLVLGGLLALLMAAVQLLPTLELAGLSSRQGGLPFSEVLSFSLNPLLLSQAILPGYGRSLFSEYVTFLPITGLLLAVVGAWQWRKRPEVRPVVVLAAAGLLLALGVFNPLYWLLGRLPVFDLFRAPARWLALYALGMSLLAGVGMQMFLKKGTHRNSGELGRTQEDSETRGQGDKGTRGQGEIEGAYASRSSLLALRVGGLFVVGLMGWAFAAVPLARFVPVGQEAGVAFPAVLMVVGWVVELVFAWAVLSPTSLIGRRFTKSPYIRALSPCLLVCLSLYLASRSLPYNSLTTPEAYFDLRPPVTRLQVEHGSPGRFLSLSGIFFDPGDQGEIDRIYGDQLPVAARYDYTIAIKQKEIIGPNLSLAYGLEAVDGFDGGLLPLRNYTLLTSLILPDGRVSNDGRLREYLTDVPESRWLDLFNARFLITDKVGDSWHVGVFFDLQHPVRLTGAATAEVGYLPVYEATELWLAAEGSEERETGSEERPEVEVVTDGGERWQLTPELLADHFYRVRFPSPAVAQSITLSPCPLAALSPCVSEWQVNGLTLVDERDGTFQPLVLGQYRLIHSGDVKIYENLDVLPRAVMVNDWQWRLDGEASAAVLADPAFDSRQTAVLVGEGDGRLEIEAEAGQAVIESYEAERVIVRTESAADSLLVLSDAWYPGWQATVDGRPVEIYQADVLFRGVFVPAGEHEVVFAFLPGSVRVGGWLSAAGLVVWLFLIIFFWHGRSFGAIVTTKNRSE